MVAETGKLVIEGIKGNIVYKSCERVDKRLKLAMKRNIMIIW